MTRGKKLLCFSLLFFSILPACGKKAPPVALDVAEPAPASDLAVWAKDGKLLLGWSQPRTNTDGSRLQDLIGFRVFRRERPYPFSPCVSCPDRFEPVAEIDVDYPREGRVEGGRVLWEDNRIKPEREYTYYVMAYNSERVPSAESNVARKLWATPPGAPHSLGVETLDRALHLSWRFEKQLVDGRPIGEGPFFLSPADLKNPSLFALKLWGRTDPLPQFLWEKLTPETRRLVEAYDFSVADDSSFQPIADQMVENLNEVLKDPSLYEEERWEGVSLSLAVKKRLAQKPQGEAQIHLNRVLLEEAFPWDIERFKPELAGFNLYRRANGGRFGFSPINSEPVLEGEFLDENLENGKRYIYSVHAIRNFRGSLIEGPGSKEILGIPEKRTPPVPPMGLTASRISGGVELRWNRNPEPDIAGYDVYRKAEGEETLIKINPQPIIEPYFLDSAAEPRKTYHYRLKAVDSSPGKMESEFSLEVESRPGP